MITEGYSKGFDIDLKYGKMGEEFVDGILDGGTKVEVKTERDIWAKTGNIAIEIRYRGKPSGLSTTESTAWVHLLGLNDEIVGGFVFNVDKLKERVKTLVEEEKAEVKNGGDDNASQVVLVPIKELFSL